MKLLLMGLSLIVTLLMSIGTWAASSVKPAQYVQAKTSIPNYSDSQKAIVLNSKQAQFSIRLPSNRTTGYRWFIHQLDDSLVSLLSEHYDAPHNPKLLGAPGSVTWTFHLNPKAIKGAYRTHIGFVYARPWEVDKAKASNKRLRFTLSTLPDLNKD